MLDEILCNNMDTLTFDELKKVERDLEHRCERIEYGLQAIGAMMQSLSYFAQCPKPRAVISATRGGFRRFNS